MTRVLIADFGIIQKNLANAVVSFYVTDASGENTGVKAILYQGLTGTASRENPQTLDADGKLTADCYVDSQIMAAITDISSLTQRSIKKIRENPLEFSLPVTSSNWSRQAGEDLYVDLAAVQAAVAAVEGVLSDAGFIVVSTDLLGPDTIGTVATNIGSVNSVAANTANINTVAADLTGADTIGTVATSIANVNAVGANIAHVIAVDGNSANINAAVANAANINTVAGDHVVINTVAGDHAAINTVAGDHAAINSVYTNIASVISVAADVANINLVAGDLPNINLVAADLTNIDSVHGSLANINSVAGDLVNINAVHADLANIDIVAGISANVTTVATNIASVNTVAANMVTITNAANNIPKANLSATVAPGVGNDNTQGYSAGSMWVDTTHSQVYFALSVATGAAVWEQAFSSSSLSGLSDVTFASLAAGDMIRYSGSTWQNRTATQTRTDLGLVIGTNVQAQDAELSAIAGLTSAADRLPYFTGSGTASLATFTSVARTLVSQTTQALMRTAGLGTTTVGDALATAASAAAARTTLGSTTVGDAVFIAATSAAARTAIGTVIGTDVQAFDTELAALAGLTSAANAFPVFTGSGTAGLVTLTASTLVGMGATGNAAKIVLGTNLSMSGTTLNATGGGATSINGLSDAYYDTATDFNLVLGSKPTIASGANKNIGIGQGVFGGTFVSGADGNTAIGYEAMSALTSGNSNTAVGSNTLNSITTGGVNIAIGSSALFFLSSGTNNIAIGPQAMSASTNDTNNVVIGKSALSSANGSSDNVAIGYQAGASGSNNLTTGTNNIFIGSTCGAGSATATNRIAMGYTAQCLADNTIQMGNASCIGMTVGTSNNASVKALNTSKVWATVTGATGARVLADSYGSTGVTDGGTGIISIVHTTNFANVNYCPQALTEMTSATFTIANARSVNIYTGGKAIGSCELVCTDKSTTTNAVKDPLSWTYSAEGKQ